MTDFHEDVGAYLLGALSPEETAAFERALETDRSLQEEVAYLRIAADALAETPEPMLVPPDLKGRIMAVVEPEAELRRAATGPPQPSTPRRRVVAVLRPGWWSLRPGLAVAASLLVLALGAGIGGIVASRGGEEVRTIAAVHGHAKLIMRESGHATLTATRLGSAGPGRVYQVWLQRGSRKPEPTNALFGVRRDGTASVDVPGDMKGVDKVLVTSEPEGGSETPTTAPVIEVHPA